MKRKNEKYQPFLESKGNGSFSQTGFNIFRGFESSKIFLAFEKYNPFKIPPNFKIAETHHVNRRL